MVWYLSNTLLLLYIKSTSYGLVIWHFHDFKIVKWWTYTEAAIHLRWYHDVRFGWLISELLNICRKDIFAWTIDMVHWHDFIQAPRNSASLYLVFWLLWTRLLFSKGRIRRLQMSNQVASWIKPHYLPLFNPILPERHMKAHFVTRLCRWASRSRGSHLSVSRFLSSITNSFRFFAKAQMFAMECSWWVFPQRMFSSRKDPHTIHSLKLL